MSKKRVNFMCTAFRDGFQSAFGARVFTKDFLPAVAAAREAGINYFEAGGGARFQSLYFYCNEDAFQMMDSFREIAGPEAELQTLARGINVVGLESQSADIISLHAKLFKKHGISSIRNFDALNDVDNLIYSGNAIVDAGLKHQICITLMELPPGCKGAHDIEFYKMTLKRILDAEVRFDSICFKDASGTAVPSKIYETIKMARNALPQNTTIHYHTHETAGISIICNKAALEAGADAIDLSLAPCSGGTCQPDILVMWHALRGTEFDLDIDPDKIKKAESVFKDCMQEYFVPPEATKVEPLIPWSPMPGGALTSNTQMLRDNDIMDKYPEIIHAMSEVVRSGGFGTSVTPVSQFYFQQAFNNVMFGPWKRIAESYGKMVLGYFGKTPSQPDPKIIELARKQLELEPATISPLEMNNQDPTKGIEVARTILRKERLEETEENIFIIATCKEKGVTYLKGEAEVGVRKTKNEKSAIIPKNASYSISIDGNSYNVTFKGDQVTVNNVSYQVHLEGVKENDRISEAKTSNNTTQLKAPMPGKIFKLIAQSGDRVQKGDTVLILEAMKMETKIAAPIDGVIKEFLVATGDQVQRDDLLANII
jgi:pyruvate carboxylase subunit B